MDYCAYDFVSIRRHSPQKSQWVVAELGCAFSHLRAEPPQACLCAGILLFETALKYPLFTLWQDLRNHGASEHAQPMTYSAMAEDVIHFIQRNSLSDVSLIGHSMFVLIISTKTMLSRRQGRQSSHDSRTGILTSTVNAIKPDCCRHCSFKRRALE